MSDDRLVVRWSPDDVLCISALSSEGVQIRKPSDEMVIDASEEQTCWLLVTLLEWALERSAGLEVKETQFQALLMETICGCIETVIAGEGSRPDPIPKSAMVRQVIEVLGGLAGAWAIASGMPTSELFRRLLDGVAAVPREPTPGSAA